MRALEERYLLIAGLEDNYLYLTLWRRHSNVQQSRAGRQPFVMALGFVDARRYATKLAEYLTDADVDREESLVCSAIIGSTRMARRAGT